MKFNDFDFRQGKFGFIANSTGAHIAINVTDFKSHGRFEVSYVMSYENFGTSRSYL
jgi:hypothetical protein